VVLLPVFLADRLAAGLMLALLLALATGICLAIQAGAELRQSGRTGFILLARADVNAKAPLHKHFICTYTAVVQVILSIPG
jgi:hypothetical protein